MLNKLIDIFLKSFSFPVSGNMPAMASLESPENDVFVNVGYENESDLSSYCFVNNPAFVENCDQLRTSHKVYLGMT